MGWITSFFAVILDFIFEAVYLVMPVGTLGITIIIFTAVTRLLMTPLQIMQQRTTKGMAVMQPELDKIQAKYKDKKDEDSQMKMSTEMQKLYKKHKINPLSGCFTLIIQFPLIMALFKVLREASAYITRLTEVYIGLATKIMESVSNYKEILKPFLEMHDMNGSLEFDLTKVAAVEDGALGVKDLLSKLTSAQWTDLLAKIPQGVIDSMQGLLEQKRNFEWFGVNLVDTPSQLIKSGTWVALVIPLLVWISTVIYSKYTMSQNQASQQGDDKANSTMKMMNNFLPLMTAFFSLTMPAGLALYWIMGNVIMLFQQIFVSRMIDREYAANDVQ